MAGGLTPEQIAQVNALARPVEFKLVGGKDPEARIVIDDQGREVILRVKVVVGSVNRVGNDPNTGLPSYQVGTQIVLGLLKSDPELKKPSVLKGGQDASSGFA